MSQRQRCHEVSVRVLHLRDVPDRNTVVVAGGAAGPVAHVARAEVTPDVAWVVLCGVVDRAQGALRVIPRRHPHEPARGVPREVTESRSRSSELRRTLNSSSLSEREEPRRRSARAADAPRCQKGVQSLHAGPGLHYHWQGRSTRGAAASARPANGLLPAGRGERARPHTCHRLSRLRHSNG